MEKLDGKITFVEAVRQTKRKKKVKEEGEMEERKG